MLEYAQMPDESNRLPAARLVRWGTLGVLVVLAVALYFVNGRRVPPVGAPPTAPTPATPSVPASPPPAPGGDASPPPS